MFGLSSGAECVSAWHQITGNADDEAKALCLTESPTKLEFSCSNHEHVFLSSEDATACQAQMQNTAEGFFACSADLARSDVLDVADKNVGSGDKYSSVLKLMQFIGTVYGGASVTQVALNYLRAKGMRLNACSLACRWSRCT